MRLTPVYFLTLFALFPGHANSQSGPAWYRGNTHVHTIHSDGDSSPDRAVRWYKENGFHFVAVTDHDYMTPVDGLNAVFGAKDRFFVMSGVEVTDMLGNRPVHLNGLGVKRTVLPQGGQSVPEIIDRNVKAIHEAHGLAVLNHPNGVLSLALTASEIAKSEKVYLFEVCCADRHGGSGHPSTDEIWDAVLSKGRRLYGIAADDAHSFAAESRQPGNAWIMVRTDSLTRNGVLSALDQGDFYATTGVTLKDYSVDATSVRIELADTDEFGYRTLFIGRGGRVLKRDESGQPAYAFDRRELYVRARIERSDGATAWTQPVFLADIP